MGVNRRGSKRNFVFSNNQRQMSPVDNMFRPGCSLNGANGRLFFRGKDVGYPDDLLGPQGNTQWPQGRPTLSVFEQKDFSHFGESVTESPNETGVGQHPLDADHVKIKLYYGTMPPSAYLP